MLAADGSPLRRSKGRRRKSLAELRDQSTTLSTRADFVGRLIGTHKTTAVGIASPLAQIETRYGYTQDWLSSNFASLKNAERGNWWSDESSISDKGSSKVYTLNAGSSAGDDQSPLKGEFSNSTVSRNQDLRPNYREGGGVWPSHPGFSTRATSATSKRMSQDFYEILQSSIGGKSPNETSALVSGEKQPAREAFPTTTTPNKNKDLPPPPVLTRAASEAAVTVSRANDVGSPSNITRPSISTQVSFQRPRKRVNWRGKACIIALPVDDGSNEKTGAREYMKPRDVMERLEMWERQGYQTRGFSLSAVAEGFIPHLSEGQSRVEYPSLDDQMDECDLKRYRVSIPDRQEWDDYVGRLKEDKLRALGVSFEREESSSRNTSIPPSMSRQASSHNSAIRVSSPINASFSNINSGQHLNQISPRLAPFINFEPQQVSQVVTASEKKGQGGTNHLQRHSMAFSATEKPFTAAYQFPQAPSPLPPAWSSQQLLGSQASPRITSPSINGYMQGFGPGFSPGSIVSQDHGNAILNRVSLSVSPQIHHQQAQFQAHLHLQEYEQQQTTLYPQIMYTAANSLPHANGSTSIRASKSPEIANPIPRGHRQNLSDTLQKGVDEAESHFASSGTAMNGAKGIFVVDIGDKNEDAEDPPVLANILQSAVEDLSLDNSDLDTNPSIVYTPKPLETQNTGVPQGHSSKSSLSKMNANAPEFVYNPKSPLRPGIFAFSSNQNGAQPTSERARGTLVAVDQMPSESTINTTLNVAAPSFTPTNSSNPTTSSRVFSFSSGGPSFKLDDSGSMSQGIDGTLRGSRGLSEPPDSDKIFSNVSFPDIIKPAKKSKAIPIVRPKQKDDSDYQEPDGQEDESGRITQADGRQKRMRHDSGEDDQTPLFASPNDGMQSAYEVAYPSDSNFVTDLGDATQGDRPSPMRDTNKLEEIIDDIPSSDGFCQTQELNLVNADEKPWQPLSFQDADGAANINAARLALASPGYDSTSKTNFAGPTPISETNGKNAISPNVSLPLISPNDLEPCVVSVIRDVEQDPLPASTDVLETSGSASSAGSAASLLLSPSSQIVSGECSSMSQTSGLINYQDEPIEESRDSEMNQATNNTLYQTQLESALVDGVSYLESSYQEIDAVMKHLNEEDSDLGVERSTSPWRHRSPIRTSPSSVKDKTRVSELLPKAHIRSDTPSPSPNRIQEPFQYLPPSDSEFPSTALIEVIKQNARFSPSYRPSSTSSNHVFPVQRLNRSDDLPVSDWDDAISSSDEIKFQSRIKFFDHRINDLVGSIVQQRLQPLEKALVGIQDLLEAFPRNRSGRGNRRSTSAEIETSDADDEEDSRSSHSGAKSPVKDRTYEKLKTLLLETMGPLSSRGPASDIPEVLKAVKDLKLLMQRPNQSSSEIKTIVEEAIARQMRGRSAPISSSHESATVEKLQLQITGLESMLKIADTRADDELKARRATEDALADNQRLLRMAMQEAAEQRESAEETERSLLAFHDERQQVLRRTAMLEGAQESLEKTATDMAAKNAALEGTLDEYRLSSSQWRQEVEEAKRENKDLLRTVCALKVEIEETIRGRQTLSNKFDRLQEDMTLASRDIARDQSRWRIREEEVMGRLAAVNARLESELRAKAEWESTVERLEAQEQETADMRRSFERSQRENADLEMLLAAQKREILAQENILAGHEREVHHITETARLELQRTIETKDAQIETTRAQSNIISSELQRVVAQLRSHLDDAYADAKATKARHEATLAEFAETKKAALREAADTKEAALHEISRSHERVLSETSFQHARTLENALEDKMRVETSLNERLALANERIFHLEDKSSHLEEKLEIAKSAAHAAVLAAQSKKLPPSPSTNLSLPPAKDYDLPEKISPQALRESILVLQEQLQARETHIEQLEKELLRYDREAPAKLKNQEMEITWLRELLCVRVDDLEEIITTLSYPSYDREAIRDAAIRIKAGLEMEQQGKERMLTRNSTFPSLSSITTIASSPRALPLAAAAAWGNWRKAQDITFGDNSESANGSGDLTSSRASLPARGFLSGFLTPPRTNTRQSPSPKQTSTRTSTVSLGGANQLPDVYRTPRKNLSRQAGTKLDGSVNPPATPPLMRETSYDFDAESTGLGGEDGEVPTEGHYIKLVGATLDEPFGFSHESS